MLPRHPAPRPKRSLLLGRSVPPGGYSLSVCSARTAPPASVTLTCALFTTACGRAIEHPLDACVLLHLQRLDRGRRRRRPRLAVERAAERELVAAVELYGVAAALHHQELVTDVSRCGHLDLEAAHASGLRACRRPAGSVAGRSRGRPCSASLSASLWRSWAARRSSAAFSVLSRLSAVLASACALSRSLLQVVLLVAQARQLGLGAAVEARQILAGLERPQRDRRREARAPARR